MKRKISEKTLLASIACFIIGNILLVNSTIITEPVLLSEKGILITIVACLLFVYGSKLFSHSVNLANGVKK
jgi:uncharacterized membrane protein